MTIMNFLSLFADEREQVITIFDYSKGEDVFTGDWYMLEDTCEDYLDAEICSIDNLYDPTTIITINVSTEEA